VDAGKTPVGTERLMGEWWLERFGPQVAVRAMEGTAPLRGVKKSEAPS
jgi:hypothetical protein